MEPALKYLAIHQRRLLRNGRTGRIGAGVLGGVALVGLAAALHRWYTPNEQPPEAIDPDESSDEDAETNGTSTTPEDRHQQQAQLMVDIIEEKAAAIEKEAERIQQMALQIQKVSRTTPPVSPISSDGPDIISPNGQIAVRKKKTSTTKRPPWRY